MNIPTLIDSIRNATLSDTTNALNAFLEGAVEDPEALAAVMPPFEGDELAILEENSLSIYFVRFVPGELVPPHDHRVAAFIGVFKGVEVNRLYRRRPGGGIELVREKRLGPGATLSIGGAGIHSVYPGNGEESLAIHVYLGNLKTVQRSVFHPETGEEMPFNDENFQALLRPSPE